jgi:hypothetical protein
MLNLVNIQQVLNDYENLKNELSRIIYGKRAGKPGALVPG